MQSERVHIWCLALDMRFEGPNSDGKGGKQTCDFQMFYLETHSRQELEEDGKQISF